MMPVLRIRKTEGDYEHILMREGATRVAAHLQLPRRGYDRRVVVAMPAGKAALCFATANPADWALDGEVTPFAKPNGLRGVRFVLTSDKEELFIPTASLLLNHTLMARFGVDQESRHENRLRKLIESGGIREIETRLGLDLQDLSDRGKIIGPVPSSPQGSFGFTRRALDGKHRYRLEFAGAKAVKSTRKSRDSA